MSLAADPPGAARLELAGGVVHLDPAPAVFEAMLAGWARQQRTRFLKDQGTIEPRIALVRRLARFSGQYPWEWGPAEAEEFIVHLRSPGRGRPIVVSTARGYESALRMFMEYVTDARYGWPAVCVERFERPPQQIFHEWNTVAHVSGYEGQPGRRPLTYEEVQALFDAADARVGEIRARGRKGSLAALRDAVMLKTVYAFGLRRQETCGLDLADLRRNPRCPEYGRFGGLFVRYGKSSGGSAPRRRTVLTVPEMDWIAGVVQHYLEEVRPLFSPGSHPALWVTERRGRLSKRAASEAFETVRGLAGLPAELDLHALRHSYITHLVEFDYPEKFVSVICSHHWGVCDVADGAFELRRVHVICSDVYDAALANPLVDAAFELCAPPRASRQLHVHDAEPPPHQGFSKTTADNAGAGRTRLRQHDGDLHGRVGRVPQPAAGTFAAGTARRSVGGPAVIRKMGYRWHLRHLMAARDIFQTSELVPLLAERGVTLSREQVFRLVTQPPQRLSMDTLAALCDILGCTPNDLIEIEAVSEQVRKDGTSGGSVSTRGHAPRPRRTTVRRPEGL